MNMRQNLDGDWAFAPVNTVDNAHSGIHPPALSAYETTPIRVPGYWRTFPNNVGGDWGAYDHYRYPPHWQEADAACYRTTFKIDRGVVCDAMRTRLHFDAVAGECTAWLNGTHLGTNVDSFLPFAFDVDTLLIADDDNELVVLVEPPPQKDGLWLQPPGSWVGWHMRGIWQSVYIECRPTPAIADVFVQPSVRQKKIKIDVTVETEPIPADAKLQVTIHADGETLDLGAKEIDPASGEAVVEFERNWLTPRLWSPEDPHLYHATAKLLVAGKLLHERTARFGFREFWIDGTEFLLNGQPIRLFGDSWHYMGVAQQNPGYAATWYRMAMETGVNAIRTHAMPYPPCYFDVADEMGMLIIDESAVYGSAGTLAYDEERFWDNSREHMCRLVRRDRNHPSIIFWSACNETVWKGGEAIFDGLRSLANEAKQLDPTRFVSFDENDCDLGGSALLHAGHYGTPAHWDRSWKRDKPLVLHEFCALYHGGPDSVCGLGNDEVYADYLVRLRATGEDAADMFCKMRSIGAASITPWNINWYCGTPLPEAAVESIAPETTKGGPTIDRIGPQALTLNYGFLPADPSFIPNPAYAPLKACYQRSRFFLRHRSQQAFGGAPVSLEPELWHDAPEQLDAQLELTLRRADEVVARQSVTVSLGGNASQVQAIAIEAPQVRQPEALSAFLALVDAPTGEAIYEEKWTLHVHPTSERSADDKTSRRIFVTSNIDLGSDASLLPSAESGPTTTEALRDDTESTLILAENHRGWSLQDWLASEGMRDWLEAGGRIVVLPGGVADDACSALSAIHKGYNHAYPRDCEGGIVDDLTPDHFRDWADDGTVASDVYQRPASGPAFVPLDVGDPAEGMCYAPLVIIPCGFGQVVMCGLDLHKHRRSVPAAAMLLDRLLHDPLPGEPAAPATVVGEQLNRLAQTLGLADSPEAPVLICDGSDPSTLADPRLTKDALDEHLAGGGVVMLQALVPETADAWSQRLGIDIQLSADLRYNVARTGGYDLLAGINNHDLCWVDRDDKQPITRYTLQPRDDTFATLVKTVATRWEGYQTAAEQHKVGMMYRRMKSFSGSRTVVAMARRGMGRIVISQMLLHEAAGTFAGRAHRVMSRLLDNLGARRDPSVGLLVPRERRIVDADGYITDWLVLGPFSDGDGNPLDHPFVDEAAMTPVEGQSVGGCTWRPVSSPFPQIDLGELLKPLSDRDRVAYAAIHVYAPQDRSVLLDAPDMIALHAGADGGTKVFLDGKTLGRFDFVREFVPDSDRVEGLPLQKGWNTLVIKLHNPSGDWRFSARLLTASGETAGDLTYQIEPPAEG